MIWLDEHWIREIYGRENDRYRNSLTFAGALEACFRDISFDWKAKSTERQYRSNYNRLILPAIREQDNKCIWELTREDFEEALESIRETGYTRGGEVLSYSESSLDQFRMLIYRVVFYAANMGLCDNVLWGTPLEYEKPSSRKETSEDQFFIRKSLLPLQEKKLVSFLTSDIAEDGGAVGLLLMFSLGLRNGEACGLNYGDIKPLREHPDCRVAWIYKSTKIGTNELQAGGKTLNAGRLIPVPRKVLDFLFRRKGLIARKLADWPELRGREEFRIENMPICCDGYIGDDPYVYIRRCSANCLSNLAHSYFEAAGITSRQVMAVDADLSDRRTAETLNEKDPKAYLLRRNFATHMKILGLTTAEMQYLIGHSVEDSYETRNDFVNDDRIYSMHLKLAERPLMNEISSEETRYITLKPNTVTRVRIESEEPFEPLHIELSKDKRNGKLSTQIFTGGQDREISRQVNILETYHKAYE